MKPGCAERVAASVRLSELVSGIATVPAGQDCLISGLASDSRQVRQGDLFLALAGQSSHGLDYFDQICQRQAAAVLWQSGYEGALPRNPVCPLIEVAGLSGYQSDLADRFYGPSLAQMQLIGITGTDGKTSCSHFIAQCLAQDNQPCGLAGTLGVGVYGRQITDSRHLTTPDKLTIRRWLAEVYRQGGRYAVMEVSSHALAQDRVAGLEFKVAVLSNLTRDHLDYHGSIGAYADAKRRLFCDLQPVYAVLNFDDDFGRTVAVQTSASVVGYRLSSADPELTSGVATSGVATSGVAAMISAHRIQLKREGIAFDVSSPWGQARISSPLLGRFNVSNLLATLAVLQVLGFDFNDSITRLNRLTPVPGRMELIRGTERQPAVVVDFAHTPHALEQVLKSLREHCDGRLWCVFGCGGERDSGKRPLMGAVAASLADELIVTSDNPRNECPETIIGHIIGGIGNRRSITVEPDRAGAIARAIVGADAKDIVLIAGKGHEDYQLLHNKRIAFSDQNIVRELLR